MRGGTMSIDRVKTIGVIGGEANLTNVALVEAWCASGLQASLFSPTAARAELEPGDIAIGRLDVLPTLDGIEDGLLELLELRADGVRVVNSARALLNAHDKLRTARRLSMAGVPHVPTWHVRAGDRIELEPPLVVKPRFGSWGVDVLRCDDDAAVQEVFAEISTRRWFQRHGAIVQPLVAPMGRDLRVLVAGGVVVGGEARVSASGEWRTNISLGGTHLSTPLWNAPATLAVAAATAVGGEFVGIDLLPSAAGYLVLEVNAAVEFDLTYSTDGDVYGSIAEALCLTEELAPALAAVAV